MATKPAILLFTRIEFFTCATLDAPRTLLMSIHGKDLVPLQFWLAKPFGRILPAAQSVPAAECF
jgi:hypothetical protein